ncbi:MAG: PilT/PilU family type 4a pilus ATPase [Pirellulales bacterium]
MSTLAQQIFKRVILHNKLLAEADLEALLNETPNPEQAVKQLVDRKVLAAKTANQVLSVYRRQLDAVMAEQAGLSSASGVHAEKPKDDAEAQPTRRQAAAEPRTAPSQPGKPPQPATTAGRAPRLESMPAGKALIERLLKEARQAGASDLHLKAGMPPVVRVAGNLRDLPMDPLSAEVCEQSCLAILADGDQRQFLEANDLDFCFDGGPELGRFRANYLRQHRGMDAVFRLIPPQVPSFEELKLPDQVKRLTNHHVGIVLVTGPKGCGKTTTLAAMVDLINSSRAAHIITIEDPIEFVHACKKGHVNQRQVGMHTQSFGNALRATLREAPDVIMVGELRDLETTALAITAAETGHLVLATLHTPDALRTIGRVLDIFPAREQGQIRAMLSESLRGIVSQLLLPSRDGKSMVLALEILINTPAIGHLIREERVFQITGLMQTGKKLGMALMDESLIRLAREGRISKEEAISRAAEAVMVEKELIRV